MNILAYFMNLLISTRFVIISSSSSSESVRTFKTNFAPLSICSFIIAAIFAIFFELGFTFLQYAYEVSTRDSVACAPHKPNRINNVLYCRCSDNESQRPGKCSEKYK